MNKKMLNITKEKLENIINLANAGDAGAQYTTAILLLQGEFLPENEEKAVEYLEKAHAQGFTEATYELAVCCHYGIGMDADMARAFELYKTSAEAGYGMGMAVMGKIYLDGNGVESNPALAMEWFEKAIASKDTEAVAYAEFLIAGCYRDGIGVEKDEDTAMEWYKKSALHGDIRARRIVGMV
ncbi:MAG: sel1 repeat family protein [Ruminococcaceae bacterium]|nr:sel1 repeat family protein [Oscillospiraceae bacterium]